MLCNVLFIPSAGRPADWFDRSAGRSADRSAGQSARDNKIPWLISSAHGRQGGRIHEKYYKAKQLTTNPSAVLSESTKAVKVYILPPPQDFL